MDRSSRKRGLSFRARAPLRIALLLLPISLLAACANGPGGPYDAWVLTRDADIPALAPALAGASTSSGGPCAVPTTRLIPPQRLHFDAGTRFMFWTDEQRDYRGPCWVLRAMSGPYRGRFVQVEGARAEGLFVIHPDTVP